MALPRWLAPRFMPLSNGVGDSYYGHGTSGGDGSYVITGLISGNYKVQASASGYLSEYYNNVYDSNSAASIIIVVLNNTPDINFTLDKGGSIWGHVYKSDGITPIANASVSVFLVVSGQGTSVAGTGTGVDGSFTITNLYSGSYKVQAWPQVILRNIIITIKCRYIST